MSQPSNRSFTIFVKGKPKGAPRARAVRAGKHARVYPGQADMGWREQLYFQLQDHVPEEPFAGPLLVQLSFWFCRPNSHFGTGKNSDKLKPSAPKDWHWDKPDRDNLDKTVLDVMNNLGFFAKDDCQACAGAPIKRWSGVERVQGVEILMVELEGKKEKLS